MIDAVRVCVSMKSRATRVLFTGPNKFSNGWRKSNRQSDRYDMALTDFNVQRRSGCPDGGGLMTAAVVTGADVSCAVVSLFTVLKRHGSGSVGRTCALAEVLTMQDERWFGLLNESA